VRGTCLRLAAGVIHSSDPAGLLRHIGPAKVARKYVRSPVTCQPSSQATDTNLPAPWNVVGGWTDTSLGVSRCTPQGHSYCCRRYRAKVKLILKQNSSSDHKKRKKKVCGMSLLREQVFAVIAQLTQLVGLRSETAGSLVVQPRELRPLSRTGKARE